MSLRLENLVEALRQLSATGSDGFEGFVRDLLTEVTGHGFRLLKSGHQGGIDVLQEPLANGLVIGLEGKRYGEATTLPLDSLQYKLFDATRSHPALDLWLLAATREISATDAKALRQLGEELGVTVDIAENVAEIRARIDPQALGYLLTKRNCEASDLDAFADFVKDQIEAVLYRSGSRTIPSYWTNNDKALDLLVRHRSDEVLAWLKPLSENRSDIRANVALAESFPLVGLTRALLRHRPVEGAQLWSDLEELYKNTILHLEKFEVLPIEAPDHPSIIELRDKVLDQSKTDFDLLNIAAAVIEHDRQSWLIDCIERDLKGASAGLIARAMTLAGFLDSSAEAEAVWSGPLASAPAPGWLAHVHDWSRKLYRRNRWAHQWLDAFVSERDRDRAFGYHALFLACLDRRALIWAPRQFEVGYDLLPRPWRNHLSLRWPEVIDQAKRVDDQYKKRLYNTETFDHTQAPWL